jgi:hypothetical protein
MNKKILESALEEILNMKALELNEEENIDLLSKIHIAIDDIFRIKGRKNIFQMKI